MKRRARPSGSGDPAERERRTGSPIQGRFHVTSLERRRERRYQRRKAARERKKLERYAANDRFENIARYRPLYNANRLSRRNVCWKASVQRYQMNLLRNLEETRAKLMAGETITKHGLSLMKPKQGRNVYALLKSQIVSVAKRVTSSIRERNLAGKPLSDKGSMPEFVNYVVVEKLTCTRFMLYET